MREIQPLLEGEKLRCEGRAGVGSGFGIHDFQEPGSRDLKVWRAWIVGRRVHFALPFSDAGRVCRDLCDGAYMSIWSSEGTFVIATHRKGCNQEGIPTNSSK